MINELVGSQRSVTPAKAGVHNTLNSWIPACKVVSQFAQSVIPDERSGAK
jgi:hypothetical protein